MVSDQALKMIGVTKDKKGRYVFYNQRKQIAYIVPENRLSFLFFFAYRYVFSALLGFSLFTFGAELILIFGLLVLVVSLVEYYYRQVFLKRFKTIENFKAASTSKMIKVHPFTYFSKAILYLVLAGLVVQMALTTYKENTVQMLLFFAAGACVFLGIKQIADYFKSK